MSLDELLINYTAVLVAAILYFILGAIWYAPGLFGNRWLRHEERVVTVEEESYAYWYKIGSYLGEFILDLIIAYVLAIFIEISEAYTLVEGAMIALWVWIGFIATTHFSAVIWARKTLQSFFIHAMFMLIGLLIMGITIVGLS